jgi:hypothetical protein
VANHAEDISLARYVTGSHHGDTTFFLEQYDTVRAIVNDMFLRGLDDDQLRHQPKEGLNSIALVPVAHVAVARFRKYISGEPTPGAGRFVDHPVECVAP